MADKTKTTTQPLDVKELAKKYGISEEVLSKYIQTFGIKTEEELIGRLEKQGYAKIWPKTLWGKLGAPFRTDRGLIESILNETDQEEKARYASSLEAAMLVELAAKNKGLRDKDIKIVIENLATATVDVGDVRLNVLQFIGIAYDGFDYLGQNLEMPTTLKNAYMETAIEIIGRALFDENKNLKEGKALFDSVAYMNLTLAKGYSIIIANQNIKEDELKKEMNTFYDNMNTNMNGIRDIVERLVKEGKLPKKYLKDFDKEHAKYVAVYATVSMFYAALQQLYKQSIEQGLSEEQKKKFEEEYRKKAAEFAQMNENAAAKAVVMQFSNYLIQERLRFRSSKHREEFSIVMTRRSTFLTQLLNSMSNEEYLNFVAELLDEDWDEKTNKEGKKYKSFTEYLEDKIKEKWLNAVWPQIKEAMAKQGINVDEKNENTIINLLWNYGYNLNDVAFMLKNNIDLDNVAKNIDELKKENNEIRKNLVELAKRAGIKEEFIPLFLEPLIRRIALIQTLNDKLPENERIDVNKVIKEHLNSAADLNNFNNKLKENPHYEKLPEEQQQGLRVLSLVESLQPKLPVKYVKKVEPTSLQPQAQPSAVQVQQRTYHYKPQEGMRGYNITTGHEYSQQFLGYYPSVAWLVKWGKGRIRNIDELKNFIITRYFGSATPEIMEVYGRRYNEVYNYFLQHKEEIFDLMSFEELKNLRDSARRLIKELGLNISVDEAAAALFAIQAVEYPYEQLVGKQFNAKNWIDGWKVATQGITVKSDVFASEQKLRNIRASLANAQLSEGTYNIDILRPNGERVTVYQVIVDKNGRKTVKAVAKDDIKITKDDRLILTNSKYPDNIIMASSASMAVLMLSSKDQTYDAQLWKRYFVQNGNVELGYGSVSQWGGEFDITTETINIVQQPSKAPQVPVQTIETYNMLDYVGSPFFLPSQNPKLALLPLVPVLKIQETTQQIVTRTDVIGYSTKTPALQVTYFPSDLGGQKAAQTLLNELNESIKIIKEDGVWKITLPEDIEDIERSIDNLPSTVGDDTKGGLKNVIGRIKNNNYTTEQKGNKIIITVKDEEGKNIGTFEFDTTKAEDKEKITGKVKEVVVRELTPQEKQKAYAEALRGTFILGAQFQAGPLTIQPQVMFINGHFVNPGIGASTALPIVGNEDYGLALLLSGGYQSGSGLAGMAALSPYARLGDLTVSPFAGYGYNGLAWGAGATYTIGGVGNISASWARTYVPIGLINAFTVGYEHETFGSVGVTFFQIGPYIVPVPTVIAKGISRGVEWFLEKIGLRTEDAQGWTTGVTDPSQIATYLYENASQTPTAS